MKYLIIIREIISQLIGKFFKRSFNLREAVKICSSIKSQNKSLHVAVVLRLHNSSQGSYFSNFLSSCSFYHFNYVSFRDEILICFSLFHLLHSKTQTLLNLFTFFRVFLLSKSKSLFVKKK